MPTHPSRGKCPAGLSPAAPGIAANRAALNPVALAELIFSRQAQPLAFPRLAGLPQSYKYDSGDHVSLQMAKDLAALGLGSTELWQKHEGHAHAFIEEAVQAWLDAQGAAELRGTVSLSLSITDTLGGGSDVSPDPWILLSIETSGAGALMLGDALGALEREEPGLGPAFLRTLTHAMYPWMRVYDYTEAECLVERWVESIEIDMDSEREPGTLELTLAEHCERNEIDLPDLRKLPEHMRHPKDCSAHSLTKLLRRHAGGPYQQWIETVLELSRLKPRFAVPHHDELWSEWDGEQLPVWIVASEPDDAICRCFDEEAQTMYDASNPPACLFHYRPGDVAAISGILRDIAAFVLFNRLVGRLARHIELWKEAHHDNGCTDRQLAHLLP